MKIAFLIRSLTYGGAERQLVELVKGLHARGHEVIVLVFYPDGPLEPDLKADGITVRSLDKGGRWDILPFLWRLVRQLRSDRADILHSYLGMSNLLTAALRPLLGRLRLVWGVRASNMDLERYDWLERLSYRVECALSKRADLIIVNSHAGRDHAAHNGFPRERMRVIPNGIDTQRFVPDAAARQRIRHEWGVMDDEPLVGLVGRLDPMKDHPTFFQAGCRLVQENEQVRLVCVGTGEPVYEARLRTLADELGLGSRIIWAGPRADMPAIYNALDVVCSASSFGEGFPNVIGEAMACGVPCVVTDVGDSPRVVGPLGSVVPPRDPAALAIALIETLERHRQGDRSERARSLRHQITVNFSKERLAEETHKVLTEIL